MTDLIVFGGSAIFVFGILFFRFRYMKSLTGIGNGGAVGPSYWGNYSANGPDINNRIQLPNTTGICPRCVSKHIGYNKCAEH